MLQLPRWMPQLPRHFVQKAEPLDTQIPICASLVTFYLWDRSMNNQNVCSLCYFFKQMVLMYKDTVVHSWVFTISWKNWKLPAFQYNVTSISIQRYKSSNIPPANCCYRFQQWFLLQTWLWTWKDNAWGKNQNNKLHVCTF